MRTARRLALMSFVLATLTLSGSGAVPRAGGEAVPAAATGGGTATECRTLRYERVAASALAPLDPARPNTGRTFRVALSHPLACSQSLARVAVEIDAAQRLVTLGAAVWSDSRPCGDPPRVAVRPVPLLLPTPGRWTVRDGSGAARLEVDVRAAPDRAPDPGAAACELDDDCPDAETCLGFAGAAGPTTRCAAPCEFDVDCPRGRCGAPAGGPEKTCEPSVPGCADAADCPPGHACAGSRCEPDFRLGQDVRRECRCDADCVVPADAREDARRAPLRCVQPRDPARPARCEVPCASAGRWCGRQHWCGGPWDASGLASVDSVCGWMGE
jgi:hypothetical protein